MKPKYVSWLFSCISVTFAVSIALIAGIPALFKHPLIALFLFFWIFAASGQIFYKLYKMDKPETLVATASIYGYTKYPKTISKENKHYLDLEGMAIDRNYRDDAIEFFKSNVREDGSVDAMLHYSTAIDYEINRFLAEKRIDRDEIIDIKYWQGNGETTSDTALVIYSHSA